MLIPGAGLLVNWTQKDAGFHGDHNSCDLCSEVMKIIAAIFFPAFKNDTG